MSDPLEDPVLLIGSLSLFWWKCLFTRKDGWTKRTHHHEKWCPTLSKHGVKKMTFKTNKWDGLDERTHSQWKWKEFIENLRGSSRRIKRKQAQRWLKFPHVNLSNPWGIRSTIFLFLSIYISLQSTHMYFLTWWGQTETKRGERGERGMSYVSSCFSSCRSRVTSQSEELCIGLVVLTSGDAHLAITVLCGSVFTFTDFFCAQWRDVNIVRRLSWHSLLVLVFLDHFWSFQHFGTREMKHESKTFIRCSSSPWSLVRPRTHRDMVGSETERERQRGQETERTRERERGWQRKRERERER
jgi:hypothetical protein